jgi:perosamine synthetase
MVSELDRTAASMWLDPDHATPFAKGRVALYAILRALGVGKGDEVVVPGFTCVVVPAAICYTGARPVYHDIDPVSLQGSPTAAASAITGRTRAVIVQHNFGSLAPFGGLRELCATRGIALIEDCAHAMGARFHDAPAGTFGDAAFGSLQWSKPTTTGLGGIARACSPELARTIKDMADRECREPGFLQSASLGILSSLYRSWYRPSWYWTAQGIYRWAGRRGLIRGSSTVEELSSGTMPEDYRQRFGTLRAGSLKIALQQLPSLLLHRRNIHAIYRGKLKRFETWRPPEPQPGEMHAALRYPVLVENRAELLSKARKARIELGDWFNAALHPAGSRPEAFGYHAGVARVGAAAASRIINLPTHKHVSEEDAERVLSFVVSEGRLTSAEDWQRVTEFG